MDKNTNKEYWEEIKTKLKQHWTRFSENELVKMKGFYQKLKGELQKKYANKKEETEKELNGLKDKLEKGKKGKKKKNEKD